MTAYPDTSFLCGFYLKQSNSPAAAAHAATMREPLRPLALSAGQMRYATASLGTGSGSSRSQVCIEMHILLRLRGLQW
jgi:hypothetical protein